MSERPFNHPPETLRERVAFALCTHDVYGGTRYTQLDDDQLNELTRTLTYLNRLGRPKHGIHTTYLQALVAREREARGWDHEAHKIHIKWRERIVEDTWREWLPMADAAMTCLRVIPEIAQVLSHELDMPTTPRPIPDPIPDPPAPPSPPRKPPGGKRDRTAA